MGFICDICGNKKPICNFILQASFRDDRGVLLSGKTPYVFSVCIDCHYNLETLPATDMLSALAHFLCCMRNF